MLTLFGFNVSPYVAKVRAALRYKGLAFTERLVHPLDRAELIARTGQTLVPALDDDGQAVADSSAILAHLDRRFPSRPILPADAELRTRALLLEDWSDEAFPAVLQPLRWIIGDDARRTAARFRSAYAPGLFEDLRMGLVNRAVRFDMRRKYGGRAFAIPSAGKLLRRFAETLDLIDATLNDSGWLIAATPTVADFAVYGWLSLLDGLDVGELVRARPRIAQMLQALAQPDQPATDAAETATA